KIFVNASATPSRNKKYAGIENALSERPEPGPRDEQIADSLDDRPVCSCAVGWRRRSAGDLIHHAAGDRQKARRRWRGDPTREHAARAACHTRQRQDRRRAQWLA